MNEREESRKRNTETVAGWSIPQLAFEYRQAGRFPFDEEQLGLSDAISIEFEKREQEMQRLIKFEVSVHNERAEYK